MSEICIHPWADVWINAKGSVTCCPQNSTTLGNINTETFSSLWNSISAQQLRHYINKGDYKTAGCDRECPFLRGSYSTPSAPLPLTELINPEFDVISDNSLYADNYHKVMADIKLRRKTVLGLPLFVDIQPILSCNANCVMCRQPHNSPLVHSDITKKSLEELIPSANYFRWQGGEVFLLKEFPTYLEKIDKISHRHFRKYIITNGSVISPDILEKLTNGKRPVHFLISIDGTNEKTYYKIRRKSYFANAMKTLTILASIQKAKKQTNIVRWNYVVMKSTMSEMIEAIDIAEKLEVNINFAPLQGDFPLENIFRFRNIYKGNIEKYFRLIEEYAMEKHIQVSGFKGIQARLKNISRREK